MNNRSCTLIHTCWKPHTPVPYFSQCSLLHMCSHCYYHYLTASYILYNITTVLLFIVMCFSPAELCYVFSWNYLIISPQDGSFILTVFCFCHSPWRACMRRAWVRRAALARWRDWQWDRAGTVVWVLHPVLLTNTRKVGMLRTVILHNFILSSIV